MNLIKLNECVESERLRIVRMDKSMCYDVHRNSLDEDNKKYVPDEVFETLEEASIVVDQIIQSYDNEDGPFIYAIIRKEDNKNIGYVQLVKIDEGYEIGYHIAKTYTGHGYATEALNRFIDYLKENTNLKEIYGVVLMDNKASRKVLEKCQFKTIFEGEGMYQGNKREIIKSIRYI